MGWGEGGKKLMEWSVLRLLGKILGGNKGESVGGNRGGGKG